MMPLEEFEPDVTLRPEDYEPYIGHQRVEDLKRLAEPAAGKGWANVNSTLQGGGVAELLRSLIPFSRGLGINARWYALRGNTPFFQVTKKFHDMLQGLNYSISLGELFDVYLNTIEENAKSTLIDSDLIVVHDPQPAALIPSGALYGNILWRCHIDTSSPHQTIWRFLLPYVNQCSGAVFTMPEFVGQGVQVPLYQMFPCIDPRAEKNHQFTEVEAYEVLAPLMKEYSVDPGRPILAAVSRYDIHKNQASIIEAFRRLKAESKASPCPYLIFLGNQASDDPDGEAMLKQLRHMAGEDPDIKFWVNVENNDKVVGALMRVARAFIHVSTKEGFGLVVSEAMWQGTPVIGSKIGGIKKQIMDGENGFLVDPWDVDSIAKKMALVLEDPIFTNEMGARGIEHVRKNFLLPELMRKYLVLLRFYTKLDQSLPEFRLNYLSYSEIMQSFKRKHPHMPQGPAKAA